MGIYDRDYYRRPTSRGGFANFRLWSITTWLIVINVAVFVTDGFLVRAGLGTPLPSDADQVYSMPDQPQRAVYEMGMGPVERFGYFSVDRAIYHGQVWRFITCQFLHASPMHLAWNMLGLFFFGPMIEDLLQARRFLAFYLICGCAGGVSYILLWSARILIGDAYVPMIGASAGIFGVLIAAAVVAPDLEVTMIFIPVKLRILALIMVGISVYTVITAGANAGGEAAHIGGALAGFGLIKNVHLLNVFVPGRKSAKRRVAFRDWRQDSDH
jgi:membrane associated rhomboid family serine protease